MNSESWIDQVNEELWNDRFKGPVSVEKQSLINLAEAEKAAYTRGIAYAKLNIAATEFLRSKNESAQKYLTEAFAWFNDNTLEKGFARALLLEGNIFESFGDYEKTLSLWLQALKVTREINDVESEAEASSQLGLVYYRLSDYKKALEYFNSGLKIRQELNDENAVASSLNRIGMVLRQTKKYSESLEFYFRSMEIRKKNKQLSAIPWTLLGIGSTYEDSGNTDEALEYYKQGSEGSDRRCALQCIMGAGRINSLKGENKKAEQLLSESLSIAKELKTLYLIAEAYSALAKHYESAGNYKKALINYKLYQGTRESLLNEEAQSRLRNIEISSAVEKSEKEKEIFRLKNVELKIAYNIIEEKNTDITASINYASRIQNAILPRLEDLESHKEKFFVLFLPKDIVSGDFYWFSDQTDKLILVAGDCTGHGVPGALMSMLGISSLEDIVNRRNIYDTGTILNELSKEIRRSLHQNGENTETKDGMDIAVCIIDRKSNIIRYSGANNNLYLIRDDQIIEFKADRMPAGYHDAGSKDFSVHEIKSTPGDMIYLYSDGYADQFGGPRNKKYKYSALKEMLLKIHMLPPGDQKMKLENEFITWKAENSQVDDVLIIGYKI